MMKRDVGMNDAMYHQVKQRREKFRMTKPNSEAFDESDNVCSHMR